MRHANFLIPADPSKAEGLLDIARNAIDLPAWAIRIITEDARNGASAATTLDRLVAKRDSRP